jgi:PLP dependent protein
MIAENFNIVEAKVANLCVKSGRDRSEITLIAVSKTQPIEIIKECLAAGIKDLGENKAQELKEKSELVSGDVRWHFIGHLQTNKVKYVINSAEYIHSVETIKLAEEINRKAEQIGKKQKVLLEIKTSEEATKFGLGNDAEILTLTEYCSKLSNVELVGLMTMAPYTDNVDVIRNCFVKLRETKERINSSGFNLRELSMGMTNDYEIAIEEGATMLRIGTAIFGQRNYQ